MSELDVATATYELHAVLPDHTHALVPSSGLGWEELAGEVATRITATLPDAETSDGKRLSELVTNGSSLTVLGALGDGVDLAECARGTVEDLQPNDGTGGTFSVIAYDPLRALLANKDDLYYPTGWTPLALVRDVIQRWTIPYGVLDESLGTVTLPQQMIRGQTLADMILGWLKAAFEKGTPRLVARSTQGQLEIVRPGTNSTVYWIVSGESALRMTERISTLDWISRVKVMGRAEDGQASPLLATLDGSTDYGTRQDMVHLASTKTADEMELAARLVLDEKGRPRHDRSLEAPDVPMVRKFDKIRVTVGTIDGYQSVESVVHDEATGTMRLGLGDLDKAQVRATFALEDPTPTAATAAYVGGDMISDVDRYRLAIAAGFSKSEAVIATALAIAENRTGDPNAEHVNSDGSVDLGLWQINSRWWPQFGGKEALKDPLNNAKAAYAIFKAQGWCAWNTYEESCPGGKHNGSYRGFMDRATTAAAAAADQPALTTASVEVSAPSRTTAGFAPNTPPVRQSQNWSCSAAATAWLLSSIGQPTTETQAIALMGAAVNASVGLTDHTGGTLASVLRSRGYNASARGPLSYDQALALAGNTPLIMGGDAWNHWTGVSGSSGGVLRLANPSPGYAGVGDTLDRAQFARLGPFYAVTVAVGGEGPAPAAAPAPVATSANAPAYTSVPGNAAGSFGTNGPSGVVLHGTRGGTGSIQGEFNAAVGMVKSGAGGLGWNVTVGTNQVAEHLPPTQWGWHARESSSQYLSVDFAQSSASDAITDSQVQAFAHWFKYKALARWPNLPHTFPTHAELAPGQRDGKTDVFPIGDARVADLRSRINAALATV